MPQIRPVPPGRPDDPGGTGAPAPGGDRGRPREALRWWRELLLVLALYLVYEAVRDTVTSTASRAYADALRVLSAERAMGLAVELPVQQWTLERPWVVEAADAFYASVYAVSTVAVLVWAFRTAAPARYLFWRNALAATTGLALVGFWLFPVAPPRLLDETGHGAPSGFVDTLVAFPGPWTPHSTLVSELSNPYAAMPSLHTAWALWVACVVAALTSRRWLRAAVWAVPVLTGLVVVVTANHYVLDVVGGAVVLLAGVGVATGLEQAAGRRAAARSQRSGEAEPVLESAVDDPV